jgi:putative DNA primase/helicase
MNSLPKIIPSLQPLARLKCWVLWRSEMRGDNLTKMPYQCNGKPANSIAPSTWGRFADVQRTFETGRYSGIGFVLDAAYGFVCIDIDVEAGEKPSAVQVPILEHFKASYIETSPGGGYHIWIRADLPAGHPTVLNFEGQKVCEIYSRSRFMTITGLQCLPDTPILDMQAGIDKLLSDYEDYANLRRRSASLVPTVEASGVARYSDQELVNRAKAAKHGNGELFRRLWCGQWRGLYASQSESDQTFMNIVAVYTSSPAQVLRLFWASELGKRPKAKRPSYYGPTLARAFDRHLSKAFMDANAKVWEVFTKETK